jgi:hypothetical protein
VPSPSVKDPWFKTQSNDFTTHKMESPHIRKFISQQQTEIVVLQNMSTFDMNMYCPDIKNKIKLCVLPIDI